MIVARQRDGFLTKFRRFSWEERLALVEALALLALCAPLVRHVSLVRLGRMASRRIPRPLPPGPRRDDLDGMVGWAIDRAAKRSRLRALCFERGLAAQIMLRRRGIDSTLFYGVRPGSDKPLDAHVWVLDRGFDVTGTPAAGRYATLATFPAGREALGECRR